MRSAWDLAHRSDLPETAAIDRALKLTEHHPSHPAHPKTHPLHLVTHPPRLPARCAGVRHHDLPGTAPNRPDDDEVAAYLARWVGERAPATEPGGAG